MPARLHFAKLLCKRRGHGFLHFAKLLCKQRSHGFSFCQEHQDVVKKMCNSIATNNHSYYNESEYVPKKNMHLSFNTPPANQQHFLPIEGSFQVL